VGCYSPYIKSAPIKSAMSYKLICIRTELSHSASYLTRYFMCTLNLFSFRSNQGSYGQGELSYQASTAVHGTPRAVSARHRPNTAKKQPLPPASATSLKSDDRPAPSNETRSLSEGRYSFVLLCSLRSGDACSLRSGDACSLRSGDAWGLADTYDRESLDAW